MFRRWHRLERSARPILRYLQEVAQAREERKTDLTLSSRGDTGLRGAQDRFCAIFRRWHRRERSARPILRYLQKVAQAREERKTDLALSSGGSTGLRGAQECTYTSIMFYYSLFHHLFINRSIS